MKLVAVWVENYMKIINQGFNFGSRYTYDFKFNSINHELLISAFDTPDYYDLFSDNPIKNITGIIGINGSGKTTILKLLNLIEADKPISSSVVLIFENNDSKNQIRIFNYNKHDEIMFTNTSVNIKFKETGIISDASIKNELLTLSKTNPFISEVNIIFYSTQYSTQNDKFLNINNGRNRSISYQTLQSINPKNIEKYLSDYNLKKHERRMLAEESFNIISIYEKDKFKRLISFLSAINTKHTTIRNYITTINFPEKISIWGNEEIILNTEKMIERSIYDFEILKEVYNQCARINSLEIDPRKKISNEIIYLLFFFSFYNDFFAQSSAPLSLTQTEKFIKSLVFDNSIFDKIKNYFLEQKHTKQFYTFDKIIKLIDQLDSLLRPLEISKPNKFFNQNLYEITINQDLWIFLEKITSIVDYKSDGLFGYSLNPFSAGEDAILTQFSEFYEAIEHLDKSNVIISIDEGELYLHPEWQREYLNSLYEFFTYFNFILKLDTNFQFIITSHSPFIVSDIPKHNLIFLKKDNNGYTEVSSSMNHKPTLGGNIFDLFSDGFYVKEFISAFAFNRISEAIKFLNNSNSTIFKTIDEVEKFTKLIGEPIIRNEIEKLINRKKNKFFNEDYDIIKTDNIQIEDDLKNKKDD